MSDTVNTTTDTATETPAQTAPPTEVPAQTGPPAEVPPSGSSERTAGRFSRGWRCGVAAAVIVVVAGAFFTIGWFTSTRGDHGHAASAKEISRQMNLREQGFRQGGTSPQAPSSQQGYLGVGVASVTPALQQQYGLSGANGALVISIDDTGPAFQAGIRRGDIITSIDGTSVATQQDVVNLVATKNAGDSVSVVVDRNGQSLTFQVTLTARPARVSG